MNNHVLNVFFRFYIEWTFASLILLMLHLLSTQHMPLLSTMGISASASLLFAFLLEKKGNIAKLWYLLVVMPMIFVAGFLAGLQLFYVSGIALFVFWRTLNFHQDSTSNSESVWLVLTFLVGLFLSPLASFYGSTYLIQIAFLLTFQLFFIVLGQFFIKWVDIDLVTKRKFAIDFGKLLGIAITIVLIITFGRNILKDIFFYILQGIGLILSIVLYPFFAWIDSPAIRERASKLSVQRKPENRDDFQIETAQQIFDPALWGPIVFAMIGVVIFYFIYKKTNLFNKKQEVTVSPSGYITSSSLNGSKSRNQIYKRRTGIPSNQIRKEIFQLEKFAQKKELGRFSHEAFNDWLDRLGVQYEDRTIQTYHKVRYGGNEEYEVEAWFNEDIKSIKKQLSILQKKRKEESNPGLKDVLKNVFKG
ncbi:hypothetical protein M3204_02315 [Mesobacillus subterraneus]|uniref:hypothetical protein n=1 Tax=Mesobacillus subterraneus TaxID=285983 RepID=UPI00203E059E|nr:hypothetical protein [Mesobacillus subterraneus]MCM3663222.1 hypothetical protein [Mesobacillus subterraneus]MCM3682605.1 hypothetical protein [Mesobacillus subterraneus]